MPATSSSVAPLRAVLLLDVVVRGLQGLLHIAVEEQVSNAVLLLQDGGGNLVAGFELVEEALAFLVDQDSAVAADGFGDHFADVPEQRSGASESDPSESAERRSFQPEADRRRWRPDGSS